MTSEKLHPSHPIFFSTWMLLYTPSHLTTVVSLKERSTILICTMTGPRTHKMLLIGRSCKGIPHIDSIKKVPDIHWWACVVSSPVDVMMNGMRMKQVHTTLLLLEHSLWSSAKRWKVTVKWPYQSWREQTIEICTQQCKALKKQWKVIESYVRAKAIILQKAISAQLQLYKQKLKAKHVQQQQVDEMRGNSIEDEESMNDDSICIPVPIVKSIAKKDQVMTLKTCIGQKCFQTKHQNNFTLLGLKSELDQRSVINVGPLNLQLKKQSNVKNIFRNSWITQQMTSFNFCGVYRT